MSRSVFGDRFRSHSRGFRSWLLYACASLTSLSWLGHAEAAGSKVSIARASNVYLETLFVPTGGITLTTSNLSAGADTVMHVLTMSGAPVASSDDFNGTLASQVALPASYGGQTLRLLIFSFNSDFESTATLTRTPASGTPTSGPISFGGHIEGFGTLSSPVAQTAQTPLGLSDTVVMLMSSDRKTAYSFDDDGGVGFESRASMSGSCSGCMVLVGAFPGNQPGPTTLYVDDDVNNGRDADTDGLGDGLEAAIGTSSASADSDGDGLNDSIESYGVESPTLMPLPAWGSDPKTPDVFLEADWLCLNNDCGSNPDVNQLPLWAIAAAASYYAPDIRLHVDNGVPNTNPATATLFGQWGGASRVATNDNPCNGRESGFRRVFHHMLIDGTGGGGSTWSSGCSYSSWLSVNHELGHQLGLTHGGADDFMCKPNYVSPMNYAYSYDPAVTKFSRGEHLAQVLNPAKVTEAGWGSAFDYLATNAFGFSQLSPGVIDWNRSNQSDGAFGAVTWPAGFSDCNLSYGGVVFDGNAGTENAPTYAWLTDGVFGTSLWAFTRSASGWNQRFIFKSNIDTCKTKTLSDACVKFSTPSALDLGVSTLPNTLSVASFNLGKNMIMAFQAGNAGLFYKMRTWASDWSAPAGVGTGTNGGTPALVEFPNGTMNLFTAGSSDVRRTRFDLTSNRWTAAPSMAYADGTAVVSKYTPAFTVAHRAATGSPDTLYALVTLPADGTMRLLEYDAASDRWTAFADTIWDDYHQTNAPPGLAFVPWPAASGGSSGRNGGRFYVAFNPANGGVVAKTFTEGNDPSTSATSWRLRFRNNTQFRNEWTASSANAAVTLGFNPRFDLNLRASITEPTGTGLRAEFFGVADDVFNADLKDYDDYAIMKANLSNSLAAAWP